MLATPTYAAVPWMPKPRGLNRVCLERRRAGFARVLDQAGQQRTGDPLAPMAGANGEAVDRPHRPIVDRGDRPRAHQALNALADAEAAPPDRLVAEVRDHPGRWLLAELRAKEADAARPTGAIEVARREAPVLAQAGLGIAAEDRDHVV